MKKPLDVIAGLHAERDLNPRLTETTESPAIPPFYHLNYRRTSLTRLGPYAALIIALSACSSPAVRVQYIETKAYIPIPATLTQPISVDLTNATWGSGIGALNTALQTCNARLGAIHTLVPPPVKPPINP